MLKICAVCGFVRLEITAIFCFLILLSSYIGTVTPTHYHVIYDTTNLVPDHIQVISRFRVQMCVCARSCRVDVPRVAADVLILFAATFF